jgi:cytidine deaminase
MPQQTFQFRYQEYRHLEELTEAGRELVTHAIESAKRAYAPYSSYQVGAALRLEDGHIVTGNNQENAANPSGMCAERVALFYAGARFPELAVTSLAIVAFAEGSLQEEPVSPCGGCRQVMLEKEMQGKTPMEIILYGSARIQVIRRVTDLLPLPFSFGRTTDNPVS